MEGPEESLSLPPSEEVSYFSREEKGSEEYKKVEDLFSTCFPKKSKEEINKDWKELHKEISTGPKTSKYKKGSVEEIFFRVLTVPRNKKGDEMPHLSAVKNTLQHSLLQAIARSSKRDKTDEPDEPDKPEEVEKGQGKGPSEKKQKISSEIEKGEAPSFRDQILPLFLNRKFNLTNPFSPTVKQNTLDKLKNPDREQKSTNPTEKRMEEILKILEDKDEEGQKEWISYLKNNLALPLDKILASAEKVGDPELKEKFGYFNYSENILKFVSDNPSKTEIIHKLCEYIQSNQKLNKADWEEWERYISSSLDLFDSMGSSSSEESQEASSEEEQEEKIVSSEESKEVFSKEGKEEKIVSPAEKELCDWFIQACIRKATPERSLVPMDVWRALLGAKAFDFYEKLTDPCEKNIFKQKLRIDDFQFKESEMQNLISASQKFDTNCVANILDPNVLNKHLNTSGNEDDAIKQARGRFATDPNTDRSQVVMTTEDHFREEISNAIRWNFVEIQGHIMDPNSYFVIEDYTLVVSGGMKEFFSISKSAQQDERKLSWKSLELGLRWLKGGGLEVCHCIFK